ncbi:MAG TPA: cell division protein SepF [Lachnospiraceae bacterium]|nr:cell division protein SepF [Lachnospiraceae bacterium]
MGLLDKVKNAFTQGDYDDEEYEELDDYETSSFDRREKEPVDYSASSSRNTASQSQNYSGSLGRRGNSQVVSIHTNVQMQVCIIKPEKYEDAQEICDQVKARKPVVVNLEKIEYPTAQRIMDFLSGTCYSLDGTIQRVANNIFIIAPENVDVSGDFKEELKTKGVILPWAGGTK